MHMQGNDFLTCDGFHDPINEAKAKMAKGVIARRDSLLAPGPCQTSAEVDDVAV